MSDHNIDPDVHALRGHACDTSDTAKTDAPDYTNCSGALADLGDDE